MNRNARRGQALVMVTLALFAMCGLMGLAVDLGWSYYIRRSAQRAADNAAMAGALKVLSAVGQTGTFSCGSAIGCQASSACPATGASPPASSLDTACLYAQQNGFRTSGNSGRQTVSVEANVTAAGCDTASPPTCVPTAPGVAAFYYITVRVVETVPQLFSAVMGNPVATVSARATAAVIDSVIITSLILTNRENDASPATGQGVNLTAQGGSAIQVPGGISMASQCNGGNCNGRYAGTLQGGQTLTSPFTYIRGVGQACAGNLGCTSQSSWTAPPINGKPDGDMFYDPMEKKGQPPLSTQAGNQLPFPSSIQGGTANNPTILPPGNYYMTSTDRNGNVIATGNPVTLGSGYFQFGSCGSGFPQWTFFGGLRTGSGNSVVTFTPGRYVFAGQNSGDGQPLFEISNGTTLQDCTSGGGRNTDAGEIFIFTDTNYPGLDLQVANAGPVAAIRNNLLFGTAGIKTGNNDNSAITLHGLNKQSSSVPDELKPYAPVVMWQDKRNSRVKYNPDGTLDTSCGDRNNPCTNAPADSMSREMFLRATPSVLIYGAAYQPRGAWLNLVAGGNFTGPLQVITGALRLQGSPPLSLTGISNPITVRKTALVE
ncbi:MAG TPA: pilus assembly protein TadG-related protein [Bryobacteraceae bacterium]|nr:pilus assembly protein TadG-related protein [Bryobacteraceae bacterium]